LSGGRFLGHPAGFSTLFFTELWERFSYYGMRAILVLFLVGAVATGGMGLDDRTATAIYGLYTAGVYIASMPGGWVADRLLGAQRAVFWGGSLIALGHLVLAISGEPRTFLVGLAVIVLGTGLLKPNVSSLVGEMHRGDNAQRDAAFTLFYMAINIGAAVGPFLVALLAKQFGWHVGFAAAAVGMVLGLAWFRFTQPRLGDAGAVPPGAPQGRALRAPAARMGDALGRTWRAGAVCRAAVERRAAPVGHRAAGRRHPGDGAARRRVFPLPAVLRGPHGHGTPRRCTARTADRRQHAVLGRL
jgi:proton-dependent oligopeptide transporter, POT family